jgi:glycosyltransferase involved in cell wall biosynthesis
MAVSDTIVLYTTYYPYEGLEPFIANELKHLTKHFKRVVILPYIQKGKPVEVPNGVEVITWKNPVSKKVTKASVGRIIMGEIRHGENRTAFVKYFRTMRYTIKTRGYEAVALQQILEENNLKDALHYCYWFDHFAQVLAILKDEGQISKFVSRAHRYDLYHQRSKMGLIPFRYFVMNMVDAVITISQNGKEYLSALYPHYTDKIYCSYLGTINHGVLQSELPEEFTFVSCAGARPVKRLNLLFEAFKKLSIPATWIHLGDGETLKPIRQEIDHLPSHLKVDLRGNLSNDAVLEFYKTNPVSCFVNVSESEGLPVSIIEAMSYGIPVLATDVGGTSEIVKPEYGELIPVNISATELALQLEEWAVKSKSFNRAEIREFWAVNFNEFTNYVAFCKLLKEIG